MVQDMQGDYSPGGREVRHCRCPICGGVSERDTKLKAVHGCTHLVAFICTPEYGFKKAHVFYIHVGDVRYEEEKEDG